MTAGIMKTAGIGGTFNILHKGHRALLDRAFECADFVYIGITSDEMAASYRGVKVRSFRDRRRALLKFLHSRSYGKKFTILPLKDRYGIALTRDLDCLVVSPETLPVAEEINRLRRESGKGEIHVELVDFVLAEDGMPISATRIAHREITSEGEIETLFTEKNFPMDMIEVWSEESGKEPLLLHICCAPCLAFPLRRLSEEFLLIGFFYNTNIQPFMEYRHRLEALREFSRRKRLRVIFRDIYDPEYFITNIVQTGLEMGKRCTFCYRDRLEAAAGLAERLGIERFSTTLLSSPYQLHELVKETGMALAQKKGLNFHYFDTREGYHEGVREVREMGLYVQKYCGCLFSERDRFYKKLILD